MIAARRSHRVATSPDSSASRRAQPSDCACPWRIIRLWRRSAMEAGSPSRTAILTAIHRAAHFLIDDPPKILADSFARAFAGFSSDTELLASIDSYAFPD